MLPLVFRLLDMGRTLGMPRALWAVPQWAVRRNFIVLVSDLRGAVPEPQPIANVRWTALSDADLAQVRTIDPGLPETVVDAWHAEGQQCLLGWFGEALAYVRWDTTAPVHLWFLHRTLRLLEGDTYAGHGFTVPAFRGRGLHRAGHLMALQHARRSGCTRSISIVARWNAPALAVAERNARRQRVGTVGYWTVGAARHYHASGAVRLAGQTELYVER